MIKYVMADRKVIDDTHHITQKRGNGQLRREIWVDAQGQVTRYNLAYINHTLLRLLTASRLEVFRSVKGEPGSITVIAGDCSVIAALSNAM